jgi:multiple sugar transport system substrate-binding protein
MQPHLTFESKALWQAELLFETKEVVILNETLACGNSVHPTQHLRNKVLVSQRGDPTMKAGIRTRLFAAITLVMICSLVAACAPAPAVEKVVTKEVEKIVEKEVVVTATPAPEGPVTLRFVTHLAAEDFQKTPILEAVEKYNAENSGVQVELIPMPFEQLQSQLQLMANGGNPPDVAIVNIVVDHNLGSTGILLPLDDYLTEDLAAAYLEAPLNGSRFGPEGELLSLPLVDNSYLFSMRLDLAKQAGISGPPETMEELAADMRAVAALGTDADGNKIWGGSFDTADWYIAASHFIPFVWAFGGREFDEEGKVAINSSETLAALEYWKELADEGVMGPIGSDVRDMRQLFALGQTAFTTDANVMKGIYRSASGLGEEVDDLWTWFLPPVVPGVTEEPQTLLWGQRVVVFRGSEHPQEAFDFAYWLTTDPGFVMQYYQDTGQLPTTHELLASEEVQNDPLGKFSAEQIIPHAKAWFEPHSLDQIRLAETMATAVSSVMVGQATPEEALADLEKAWKVIINQKD